MGTTFQRWLPLKKGWRNKARNGSILIWKARLKRSIRITQLGKNHVAIGTDVKYARAHNEGLRMGFIQSVKGFTRKNGSTVTAHKRRISQRIPKRQFIGDSPFLRAGIKRVAVAEYMRQIRFIRP